jgi:hypothetical protein
MSTGGSSSSSAASCSNAARRSMPFTAFIATVVT